MVIEKLVDFVVNKSSQYYIKKQKSLNIMLLKPFDFNCKSWLVIKLIFNSNKEILTV